MTKICTVAWIHGQVQRVGFRYATLHQVKQLGLSGYVRNQDDGSVEVVACGESEWVEHLLAWLRQGGPAHARVDKVLTEPRNGSLGDFHGFDIHY